MTDRITVNEQSSIRIEAEKVMYFDPLNIEGEPHDADIVFITHSHYDHFSPMDIAKIAGDKTIFIAPESIKGDLSKAGIPADRTVLLKPCDSTSILGIPVEAVPAYNTLKPFHPKHNGWLGFVVTAGGKRIYVCGDTDATPDAEKVKCDIICIPVGGTFTMDAGKAAGLVNKLSPEAAIPTHYGSLVGKPGDGEDFEKLVSKEIKVIRKLRY